MVITQGQCYRLITEAVYEHKRGWRPCDTNECDLVAILSIEHIDKSLCFIGSMVYNEYIFGLLV